MNDDAVPDVGMTVGFDGVKVPSQSWKKCLLMAFALAAFCVHAETDLVLGAVMDGEVVIPIYGSFGMTLGDGVISVTWQHSTVDKGFTTVKTTGGFAETRLLSGTTVQILSVQYADWYVPDRSDWSGWSTVIRNGSFLANIQAKRIYQKTAGDGSIIVAPDARPVDVGILSGAFSAEGTSPSALGSVLTWDSRFNGGTKTAIGNIDFDTSGNPLTCAANAYLLNCASSSDAVKTALEGFRIESFSPSCPPRSSDFRSKGYNGRIVIKGAVTLGDWHDVDETSGQITVDGKLVAPRFFKAKLVR